MRVTRQGESIPKADKDSRLVHKTLDGEAFMEVTLDQETKAGGPTERTLNVTQCISKACHASMLRKCTLLVKDPTIGGVMNWPLS